MPSLFLPSQTKKSQFLKTIFFCIRQDPATPDHQKNAIFKNIVELHQSLPEPHKPLPNLTHHHTTETAPQPKQRAYRYISATPITASTKIYCTNFILLLDKQPFPCYNIDNERQELQHTTTKKGCHTMKHTKTMTYHETTESRELFLYATNDGDLYRQTITPIINNLRKKAQKGTYNSDKAVDAWYPVATMASNKYGKDYGYTFGVQDRYTAAVDMEEYYREEIFYNL